MPFHEQARTMVLDLIVTSTLAVLAGGLVIAFPEWRSPIRVVLGLIAILVLPGHALVSALFPKRDDLSGIERLALTLGLSVAVVPLLVLVLNYTPWGIRLVPIAASVTSFTLALAAVAAFRRIRLPREEVFTVPVGRRAALGGVAVAAVTIALIGGLVALASTLRPEDAFTEFYILGAGGMLEGYPERLAPGEPYTLIFGIGNHENETRRYAIRALTAAGTQTLATPTVPDGATWEEAIELTAPDVTGRIRVPFELHLEGSTNPYRSLHLFIDVARANAGSAAGTSADRAVPADAPTAP